MCFCDSGLRRARELIRDRAHDHGSGECSRDHDECCQDVLPRHVPCGVLPRLELPQGVGQAGENTYQQRKGADKTVGHWQLGFRSRNGHCEDLPRLKNNLLPVTLGHELNVQEEHRYAHDDLDHIAAQHAPDLDAFLVVLRVHLEGGVAHLQVLSFSWKQSGL